MTKVNIEKLERFLSDLYNIFQVHLTVFDVDFEIIVKYPEHDSAFCTKIVNSSDDLAYKCLDEDAKACVECSKLGGDIYIYRCHAGLGGAICPIRYNNLTLGYLLFEQFIDTKDDVTSQSMLFELSKKYNLDFEKLLKLRKKLKVIQNKQIESISHIIGACASYIWGEQILFAYEDYRNELDRYINQNISKNMTIADISKALGISKSSVYKLSEELYGIPLAKYIRNKRMDMAKKLLESSILSVYQVANIIGYEDFSHFSKLFKSYTGATPSKFRREIN